VRLRHSKAGPPAFGDLVGPPHPMSNLRPIIYAQPTGTSTEHPYSLGEFTGQVKDVDFQFRLARERQDAMNHTFWTGSNARFFAGKQAAIDTVLSAPVTSSLSAEEKQHMVDDAVNAFYARWLRDESPAQRRYYTEWSRSNWTTLSLAFRSAVSRWFKG